MRYTPRGIVTAKEYYSIPIYQRLFEWEEENVLTLLGDLKRAKDKGLKGYYVGMLTATEGSNELVDGQQRFTVMMLMGCVFQQYDQGDVHWKSFLFDNKIRLHFSSRPSDENILMQVVDNLDSYVSLDRNNKIRRGIACIVSFMGQMTMEERRCFSAYVYENLCFFVTKLPKNYHALDLNKYFERMNSSGKNLEPHEILKVKLLRHLPSDAIGRYMQLWNLIADVDTPMIRRREKESDPDLRKRKNDALSLPVEQVVAPGSKLINGLETTDYAESRTIAEIQFSQEPPGDNKRNGIESRCALRFPYLLLQALYWFIDGKIEGRIDEFFDPSKLLEAFDTYLKYEGEDVSVDRISLFLGLLLRCRIALDVCFIRTIESGYFLDMNKPEGDEEVRALRMLQSMLFVSSSNFTNYRWFGWLMDTLKENGFVIPEPKNLFDALLNNSDRQNPLPEYDALIYNDNVRYWFWRLDLYIWLQRKTVFSENPVFLQVAENYVFIRNRSIEHIAPQTPKTESMMVWNGSEEDNKLMNSFGNLVMISQSMNSSLSNESYEVKTAHVQSFCNGASGSIESLKLLIVHKDYKVWNRDTIRTHGSLMYKWLQEAIKTSSK